MKDLFELESLKDLEKQVLAYDESKLRKFLFSEFEKYVDYKNVDDWNKVVRVCECLAIIGWGDREAVQAVLGKFFNGNPETKFCNRYSDSRFVDAIWSKRKDGFTMEQSRTSYHFSPDFPEKETLLWDYPVVEEIQNKKLVKQRNWISKNPILIYEGGHSFPNSKLIASSIGNLFKLLNVKMNAEAYGRTINRILITPSFSSEGSNTIIADSSVKVTHTMDLHQELLKMYSKAEITSNHYYLRHRYTIGNFSKTTGYLKAKLQFDQQFSELPVVEQFDDFIKHLSILIEKISDKLIKKKLDYDFDLMQQDFKKILNEWKEETLANSQK